MFFVHIFTLNWREWYNVTLFTFCSNLYNQYVIPWTIFLPLKISYLHLNKLCDVILCGRAHFTLLIGNILTIQRQTLIYIHKSLNLVMNYISIIMIVIPFKWYCSNDHPEEGEALVFVNGSLGWRGKYFDREVYLLSLYTCTLYRMKIIVSVDLHIKRLCCVLLGGRAHLTLLIGNTLTIQRQTLIHVHKALNLVMNSISIIKN